MNFALMRPFMNTGDGGSNGGAGGGAAGGTPPPAGGTGATGTPAPAATGPWFSGVKDEGLRGYLETKNFKDVDSMADSYRNLEKLRGVPEDRLITLPGDDKPESWDGIFAKLGRPEKSDAYELSTPEGAPKEFAPAMAEQFHKAGLSKKQGQQLAGWFKEVSEASAVAEKDNAETARHEQQTNLKKEWGAAFDQNLEKAGALVEAMGLDEDTAGKLRGALGVDGFSKLMLGFITKFGINLGEPQFHTGTGTSPVHTPAGAKAKRESLLADKEFFKRWSEGGANERKQIDALYEQEYNVQK